MTESKIKMTGILLAGGMSQRMGREKGNIRLAYGYLYQYPLAVLEAVCDEILISTCNESNFLVSHRTICDEINGIGPMGGIYSSLRQSSNDLNLVLSYDMPMVTQSLFRYLISEWKDEEVLLPALADGRPEPLCGLYRKSVTEVLKDLIEQGVYAVHRILPRTRSRSIKITEQLECWHPDLFLNINREEDLLRIPPGTGMRQDEK